MREVLLDIDYLRDTNTEYWMLPVRRFMSRINLKRNEFNLLMGICRQIRWATGKK
jgi:tRNA/rRNA methyltransferase